MPGDSDCITKNCRGSLREIGRTIPDGIACGDRSHSALYFCDQCKGFFVTSYSDDCDGHLEFERATRSPGTNMQIFDEETYKKYWKGK